MEFGQSWPEPVSGMRAEPMRTTTNAAHRIVLLACAGLAAAAAALVGVPFLSAHALAPAAAAGAVLLIVTAAAVGYDGRRLTGALRAAEAAAARSRSELQVSGQHVPGTRPVRHVRERGRAQQSLPPAVRHRTSPRLARDGGR